VHRYDEATDRLARAVFEYALERVRMDPPPLDGTLSEHELRARAGRTVTPQGIGGLEALRLFAEVLAPATLSQDHPRNLSFVPTAPTEAAVLFDLVLGASSIFGGSWLEGAGAVHAENEALRWLADLAGFPASAGGTFVSGGSAANLSALVTARHTARRLRAGPAPARWKVAASGGVHSSVRAAARVMDVDVVAVDADEAGRLTGGALRTRLDALSVDERDGLFAVVATGGTTNVGVVDDLAGSADVCGERGLWFHVDAAYGGAALVAPSARWRFAGIERADSFVIDPHKWLFAPYDCAALVYRRPELALVTHTQHAEYLDVLRGAPGVEQHGADAQRGADSHPGEAGPSGPSGEPPNPSDLAFHLTRRARGLPFWFSLATHGTDAYRDAVETTLATARAAVRLVDRRPFLELVLEPELSVVVVRRLGWVPDDYHAWSKALLARGVAFCVPTTLHGETVVRLCIVNPRTTVDDLALIFDSMA
jgi:L-2,4-diaminobutyrate decarboxylase